MLTNIKESCSRKILFLVLGILLIFFQIAIVIVPQVTSNMSLLGIAFAGAFERFGFLLFSSIGVLSVVYGVLAVRNRQNPKGHSAVLIISLFATAIMASYVCAATYLTENINLSILGVQQIVAVVAMIYGGPIPTAFVLLAYPYALLSENTVAQYLLNNEYKTYYIVYLIGEMAEPAVWAATVYLFGKQKCKIGILVGVVLGYINTIAVSSLFGNLALSSMRTLADDVSWNNSIAYLMIALFVTVCAFIAVRVYERRKTAE